MLKHVNYLSVTDPMHAMHSADISTSYKCPLCGTASTFDVISTGYADWQLRANYIVQCPTCGELFLARYLVSAGEHYFQDLFPSGYFKNTFPEEISSISECFVKTYEQSMTAKNLGLTELVGIGLRKAFEFLITDYVTTVLKLDPADTLAKRIEQIDIKNVTIHSTLIRWVGNDNTHTEIKHPEFTIDDMIKSIDLLVFYLCAEFKSLQLADRIG